MKNTQTRRIQVGNRLGSFCIIGVVVILLIVLCIMSARLKVRNTAYAEQIEQLQEDIQEENDRAAEIKNLPEYIESDEYIEKVAREKLGLVYEDEVIFQAAE